MLTHLLDFTLPEQRPTSAAPTSTFDASSFRWIFNLVPQISILLSHLKSSVPHRLDEKITFYLKFIGFLHRLLVSVRYSSLDSATIHQIILNVSDSLVATLQDSLVGPNQELQILICRSLHELRTFSDTSPAISTVFHNHVIPFLQAFLKSSEEITKYGADLQVIQPPNLKICDI